jgi:hypothetical protein
LKLSVGLLPTCDPFQLGTISSTMTSSSYSPLQSQRIAHCHKVLHTGRAIVRSSTGHFFNTNKSIADTVETWKRGRNPKTPSRLNPTHLQEVGAHRLLLQITIHQKQPGNTNLTIRNCGQNPHTTKRILLSGCVCFEESKAEASLEYMTCS